MDREEVIQKNIEQFQLESWGEGYLGINSKGHLCINPEPEKGVSLHLVKV